MSGELECLLDTRLLSGAVSVRRLVGPELQAEVVDRASLVDAQEAIEECCQRWGGNTTLLLPADKGADTLQSHWQAFLTESEAEDVWAREVMAENVELAGKHVFRGSPGEYEPLLAIIQGYSLSPNQWKTVQVTAVPITDPWYVAYVAMLGHWPSEPIQWTYEDEEPLNRDKYEDAIQVQFDQETSPNALNLLDRSQGHRFTYPARIARLFLELRGVPQAGKIERSSGFPNRWKVAQQHEPHFIVVYEPGSVDDLCLLWNLRASYGLVLQP